MSSQLSLFGESSELFVTPSELVLRALPLVAPTIEVVDPDGVLSDLQSVHICISTLKRCAPKHDSAINDWPQYAVASMRRELRRAMERGQTRHQIEMLADAVFTSSAPTDEMGAE